MRLEKFVIFDVQADVGVLPLYRENEMVAIRDFEMAVTKDGSKFADNPDDYVLYHIGWYDDVAMSGEYNDPKRIITGMEAVRIRRSKQDKLGELHKQIAELEAGK